ncbi:MAG: DUF6273 domain-containing protein [Cellulomonas sp.]|jgi:hypothetical protein|nr:DUF6273 domain-containing protein [Cellulomonas sp.]
MKYQTRPPSSAEDVAAVCRQVVDGSSLVRLSGIDWRVLKVTGHQALLLADRVIGTGSYHQEQAGVTWERCDLRRWLNGQFLGSLGPPLASLVLQTRLLNGPNPVWGTPDGQDEKDQFFLLSTEEAVGYLAEPWESGFGSRWFQSDRLIAKNEDGANAWWWLRSPGPGPGCAAYVGTGGSLGDGGSNVSASSGGVRPAFWLNLEPGRSAAADGAQQPVRWWDDSVQDADVPSSTPAALLVLNSGLIVALDRPVLLGRAPEAALASSPEMPRLVGVPSPQLDISRTHAEVRMDGAAVLVTDLYSTIGVHVRRPGGDARRLRPGEPWVLAADETIDLGDGVTFVVDNPSDLARTVSDAAEGDYGTRLVGDALLARVAAEQVAERERSHAEERGASRTRSAARLGRRTLLVAMGAALAAAAAGIGWAALMRTN